MKICKDTKIIKKKVPPKKLPGLGGIKNNYLKKSSLLKKTLYFLVSKMGQIEKSIQKDEDKKFFKKIQKDLSTLGNYGYKKIIDFYYECWKIINNY